MKKLLITLALLAPIAGVPNLQAEEELLPPVTIDTGDDLKRSVVPPASIGKRGKNMVEEYRINGRLYKVKVTPDIGPPYYMMDTDGDGIMDQRHDKLGGAMSTPQWVLFSW